MKVPPTLIMILKTVKIKQGDGFAIINESDFDKSKHKLAKGETVPEAPSEPKEEITEANVEDEEQTESDQLDEKLTEELLEDLNDNELRFKAKEYGVNVTHNMKPETMIKRILATVED